MSGGGSTDLISTRLMRDPPLAGRLVEHGAQLGVDVLARGQRRLERQPADHVAQRGDGQLLDRLQRVGDLVRGRARVGDREVEDRLDPHDDVVLGDHRLRREVDDLLAQVHERPHAFDERGDDRRGPARACGCSGRAARPRRRAPAGSRGSRARRRPARTTTTTMTTIRAAIVAPPFYVHHERRRAPDFDHLDALPRGDHLVSSKLRAVHTSPPSILHAADALVVGDPLEHHRVLPDQRGRARADRRRQPAMAARHRAQRGEHEQPRPRGTRSRRAARRRRAG